MDERTARVLTLDAHEAAPRLLGATLSTPKARVRLVELEAYEGRNDPGSHAARGVTPRNAPMFAAPGTLYVYLCYGVHWLVNIVVAPSGHPGAVLVRGVEFDDGTRLSGPGRVCRALGLGARENGRRLGDGVEPVIGEEPEGDKVLCTQRVGLRHGTELPWRFVLKPAPVRLDGDRGA